MVTPLCHGSSGTHADPVEKVCSESVERVPDACDILWRDCTVSTGVRDFLRGEP